MADRPRGHTYHGIRVGDQARVHNGDVHGDVHHHYEDNNLKFKLLDWLKAPDPTSNHSEAQRKCEPGTGCWLLQRNADYKSWLNGDIRLLWLHGKAGCCKTILCSQIVDNVDELLVANQSSVLLYYYFSFSDKAKRNYLGLLLSLLSQLVQRSNDHTELQSLFAKNQRHVAAAEIVLWTLLDRCGATHIVIDGLDESPETDGERREVLDALQRLIQRCPKVRLLLTSRKESDIEEFMGEMDALPIAIESREVDRDIELYVSREIQRDRKLRSLDPATRNDVESVLASGAGGMFRWAFCQLQQIKSHKIWTNDLIQKAVHDLPKTLDDTYARMLLRVDEAYHQHVRAALQWLAFEESPVPIEELVDVCITDATRNPHVQESDRKPMEAIIEVLSALIEVIRQGNRAHVVLAHFSVKEYLVSDRIHHSNVSAYSLDEILSAHARAQCCLAYVLHVEKHCAVPLHGRSADGGDQEEVLKDLLMRESSNIIRRYPLLITAVTNWPVHQSRAESNLATDLEPGLELALLLRDQSRVFWCLLKQFFDGKTYFGGPLGLACSLDLSRTIARLCSHHLAELDITDRGIALVRAVKARDISAVNALIDAGVDINKVHTPGTTLLVLAVSLAGSSSSPDPILGAVLRAGADVNQEVDGQTPLLAACRQPHANEGLLGALLRAGADVNQEVDGQTPLLVACQQPHVNEGLLCALLRAGADVDEEVDGLISAISMESDDLLLYT